jgi:hypothetical protein
LELKLRESWLSSKESSLGKTGIKPRLVSLSQKRLQFPPSQLKLLYKDHKITRPLIEAHTQDTMNFTPLRFVILATLLGLGIIFPIAACSPTPTPISITSSAIYHSAVSTLQALGGRGLAVGSGIISERSILPGIPDLSFLFMLIMGMLMGVIFYFVSWCIPLGCNKVKGKGGGN